MGLSSAEPEIAHPDRAPAWLEALRATDEWRRAHTAYDERGRVAAPVFPWVPPCSFRRFVEWVGGRYGKRVAIVDYSGVRFGRSGRGAQSADPITVTYGELAARVAERAAWLRVQGLGPWTHVALCLPNSLDVLTLQYAAWSVGAVVSPINMDQRGRVGEILYRADYRLVFVDRGPGEFAAAYGVDPTRVISVRSLTRCPEQPEMATGDEAEPDFHDPVLILHTSGTTGLAKGAMLSPYGLLTGALALQEGFQLAADDRFLLVNPLFHINSIAFALALLGVGARIAIPPFGLHWDVAAAERITMTSMVQRHLTPVLDPVSTPDRRQAALFAELLAAGTLKWIAVGSGPLAPEVQQRFLDRGALILFRWGMSENHLGGTNMRPGHDWEYYRSHVGSTGPTNRYLNLAVVGEDGVPCAAGRGRLVQRGNILVAYSTPEANAGAFEGGWHDTGDLAKITADGHVSIVGRTKETILRSGENIYPQEVDNFLMRHPAIRFAQTVGLPHAEHSEEVAAFLVMTEDAPPERELAAYCAALGVQQRPKMLICLPAAAEQTFLRYAGPGKPQRVANQLLFWHMHWLDEAVRLLGQDGKLPRCALGYAVPRGREVGLLVLVPQGEGVGEPPTPGDAARLRRELLCRLPRASGLSAPEFARTLAQRGLTPEQLLPAATTVLSLPPEALAHAAQMNRAQVALRYCPSEPAPAPSP